MRVSHGWRIQQSAHEASKCRSAEGNFADDMGKSAETYLYPSLFLLSRFLLRTGLMSWLSQCLLVGSLCQLLHDLSAAQWVSLAGFWAYYNLSALTYLQWLLLYTAVSSSERQNLVWCGRWQSALLDCRCRRMYTRHPTAPLSSNWLAPCWSHHDATTRH